MWNAPSVQSEKAIQTLDDARQKLETAPDKTIYDEVLCSALLQARKWTALMEVARRLEGSSFKGEAGFRFFVAGAEGARKWVDLESEGKARFQANPRNPFEARAVALALARQKNWAGASEWAHKSAAPNSTADAALVLAWSSILAGKPDETAAADLKKATVGRGYRYTLAMLQASLQRPDEAAQTLLETIGTLEYRQLHPAVWTAYARICEQYGFPAEADAALARAKVAAFGDDELSAWVQTALDQAPGVTVQQ
jgi:hypothetical protein